MALRIFSVVAFVFIPSTSKGDLDFFRALPNVLQTLAIPYYLKRGTAKLFGLCVTIQTKTSKLVEAASTLILF